MVIGVDGSHRNQTAIDYAVTLAEETGRPLTLVAVGTACGLDLPRTSTAAASWEWSAEHPSGIATTPWS